MWPIGHLAVGYLVYVLVQYRRELSLPADPRTLVVLAVGTQLPDLIDKPLGFWGVLPSGRSLGHSLVVVLLVLGAARGASAIGYSLWKRPSHLRPYWLPLTVGVLSHIGADSYRVVLTWRVHELQYLAWPLLPALHYPDDAIAPWERLLELSFTPAVQGELLLAGAALGVFVLLRARGR